MNEDHGSFPPYDFPCEIKTLPRASEFAADWFGESARQVEAEVLLLEIIEDRDC
jgi:hypothetical protein